ncbi:holo-ACP synthase [Brytella acorum]|uniref:Holo-[acyl-carrier-protein] synthase n=1 Tax=Brytella acorum TaxID=2959299 RepID=A0AA35XV70_9PROT|nr:holo-ACP synthase [Brytella acorum]MDF3625563.1 holo-ACP synthase [Brytella acorum]CAI9119430.1 holo-ACP synthase [Brytella acorum]
MIVGIGTDLCDMRRVERLISRFGTRFLERAFSPEERAYADRRSGEARIGIYAKRWAAKEACVKALGTGFANGVHLADIHVTRRPGGAPGLALRGQALDVLLAKIPPRMIPDIHLSLTDEPPTAMAVVLIQALPESVGAADPIHIRP